MDLNKSINIFEPSSKLDGAEVTISSSQGRKTFHLKRPSNQLESPPLAIESFAIPPERYAELMKRVNSLTKPAK